MTKEQNSQRCKEYYRKHQDDQKKRCLANYHKWVKSPKRRKKLIEVNKKAKARQRFGVNDREEILSRFNHRCGNCGKRKRLLVHHIDNRGRKVEGLEKANNTPDNLMALCWSCHVLHHRYGLQLQVKVWSELTGDRKK